MEHSNEDKRLEERLRQASPPEMPAPDFAAWVQAHGQDVDVLQGQALQGSVDRRRWPVRLQTFSRVAAVVLVLLTLGFALGRFSEAPSLDIDALRLELEASLREEVLGPIGVEWQATLQANCDQLRDDILQQLHRDMVDFATRTLAASRAMTDQRITELIRFIDAARGRDRQRVALALEQIEVNRQRDRVQFGSGLQLLAAHTAEASDLNTN